MTTDNLILSAINWADYAAVAASAEVPTLPVSNLLDPVLARPWRVTGTTTATVTLTWGSPVTLDLVALAGINRDKIQRLDRVARLAVDTSADSWRVIARNSAGVSLYDSGTVAQNYRPEVGVAVLRFGGPVLVSSLALTVTYASTTADGYFDLGRLWAGQGRQLTSNISYGWSRTLTDNSKVTTAPLSGVEQIDERYQRRKLSFTCDWLTVAEAAIFRDEIERVAGTARQLLCLPEPAGDLARDAVIGRLTEVSPLNEPQFVMGRAFSKAFELMESL